MTVVQHLGELRYRLVISVIAFLAGATGIYLNMNTVMAWLTAPLRGKQLYFTGPADGFFVTFEIVVVGGLMLSLPVLIYQVLAFIITGCTKRERKVIFLSIPPALTLFSIGVVFGNRIIFPFSLQFLLGASEGYLNSMLLGTKYFSFLLFVGLAMGLLFQIPIVLLILNRLGLVKSAKLRSARLYGYLGISLIAGVLVPAPDLLTWLAICGPVLVLYELSIWVIYFMEKSKEKKENVNFA